MSEIKVNLWALKNYYSLTRETIFTAMDEVEAHVTNVKRRSILSTLSEAYALASRFAGVLYRPFFKQKPLKIVRAIVDRCGETYYEKNPDKLYISRKIVDEWIYDFFIPPERAEEYLTPLKRLKILEHSDRPEYLYKVSEKFFQLVGPVAQFLVSPVDAEKYKEMMRVVSGITSLYIIAHTVMSKQYIEGGPRIPLFLKLSMIYTLSGLEPGGTLIRDLLELERINIVDNYFVKEKGAPVEFWRSIRMEAFEFMVENNIIEDTTPKGYRLNTLWVKIHEEGVKRYVIREQLRIRRQIKF
jgi:hypothetical protein